MIDALKVKPEANAAKRESKNRGNINPISLRQGRKIKAMIKLASKAVTAHQNDGLAATKMQAGNPLEIEVKLQVNPARNLNASQRKIRDRKIRTA